MNVVSRLGGFCTRLSFTKILWKVKWVDCKISANPGQTCYTSKDGLDFEKNEPGQYIPRWFSLKFNTAGLRHKIGLCIRTGEIVWANGS